MHFRQNLLWASLLIAGLVGAQNTAAQSGSSSASKPDPAKEGGVASTTPTDLEYRIGPQDIVKIDVWKEMEITRTIPVRPDGKISLPLLNDVQAAGLTAMFWAYMSSKKWDAGFTTNGSPRSFATCAQSLCAVSTA